MLIYIMSLVQIQNTESFPINGIQTYSPIKNNSQIVFDIAGSENQLLDMNSIRLVFTLRVLNNAGDSYPNNFDVSNTGGEEVLFDPRTGATGIFSNITFTDSNNNILESVNNMGRLMASIMPNTMSRGDYQTFAQMRYGAFGARENQTRVACNGAITQSQKLYTGLTLSRPIPFALIGKLKVQLSLVNANQFLFGANAGDNGGFQYEISDISMKYRIISTDKPVELPKAGYTFRHFGSFNQTINATDYQNQYSFGTTNTLAVLNTFIPSTHINNYAHNSFETAKLGNKNPANGLYENTRRVDINNSSFLQNNIRKPLKFEIDEREYNDRNDGLISYDTQRSYYYMDALRPFSRLNHTIISPVTEGLGGGADPNKEADPSPVYGLGIRYDETSSMVGTNMSSGNTYLQRIRSKLDGASPNEIFTYVYSIKKLVPSPTGAVVMN